MPAAQTIATEINKLCEHQPEDFVIGEVISVLYRMLEKRGYSEYQISQYIRDRVRERHIPN